MLNFSRAADIEGVLLIDVRLYVLNSKQKKIDWLFGEGQMNASDALVLAKTFLLAFYTR